MVAMIPELVLEIKKLRGEIEPLAVPILVIKRQYISGSEGSRVRVKAGSGDGGEDRMDKDG
jgi:hypothetical protein